MAKQCYYNKFLINVFGEEKMKIREHKRMVKLDLIYVFIYFQNCPFWAYV